MSAAYYNEFDPFAAAWLRELIKAGHIAPGEVDERSIEDVKPDDLKGFTQCHFFAGVGVWSYALRAAGWPDDLAVWTGSCPCQPFSASGKKKGFKDERHRWPAWFRLIRECRPAAVFGEQVASAEVVGSQLEAAFIVAVQQGEFAKANKLAKSLVANPSFNYFPRWLDLVSTELEGCGYTIWPGVLGAHSVGAPHIRQRLYFVADAASVRFSALRKVGCSDGESDGGASGSGSERRSAGQSTRESELVRMADAADSRRQGTREYGSGPSLLPTRPEQCGDDGELANSKRARLGRRRAGEAGGEPRAVERPSGFCATGELGDTSGERGQQIRRSSSGHKETDGRAGRNGREPDGHHILAGAGETNKLGDTERFRLQGSAEGCLGSQGRQGKKRPAGFPGGGIDRPNPESRNPNPGFTNGFWSNAEWLWCRDGKYRPVEPGTFPLAHGAPARVGRLRGYGNALCAQAAKAFIEAYLEMNP